jgi:hypothetical protein
MNLPRIHVFSPLVTMAIQGRLEVNPPGLPMDLYTQSLKIGYGICFGPKPHIAADKFFSGIFQEQLIV